MVYLATVCWSTGLQSLDCILAVYKVEYENDDMDIIVYYVES